MAATEKIARFVVDTDYEDLPCDAVEKAKRTALDCMGAALAGVTEPVSETIIGYVTKLGGPPQSSLFGAGLKVLVQDAALANGALVVAQHHESTFRQRAGQLREDRDAEDVHLAIHLPGTGDKDNGGVAQASGDLQRRRDRACETEPEGRDADVGIGRIA